MLIFTEAQPPQLSPLIQYVIEEKIETPPPKPITWQDNPAQCDQTTQYIALEEPFYCIDKPKPRAYAIQANSIAPSTAPNGWYPKYQCTWYVSTKREDWKWQAIRDGYTVSKTPKAGAIAWKRGHVAFVESVNENGVVISEANYDYKGSIRTITVQASEYEYIY